MIASSLDELGSGDLDSNPSCFLSFLIFVCAFLAVLSLRGCTQAFSSCGGRGLLLVAMRGLFIVVASLVAEQRL